MIIVLRPGATDREVGLIEEKIKAHGLSAHISRGVERTIIGAIGDERLVDAEAFEGLEYVEKVLRILKPYKLVSRDFQKDDTVITVRGQKIGGGSVALFAGPCSVEGREMMVEIGGRVAAAGASFLRGGAFKPRPSPYAFQGLGEEGLRYLAAARDATGLPVATELMDPRDLDLVARYADVIQIGARNMQNFALLKSAGRARKPVLLKRGMAATLEELLLSAEYIMAEGNLGVILCERGVRTFADHTRNTLDLSVIPAVKRISHLPILVDPSHGTGKRNKVLPMSRAAVAAGADGLIIEVHHKPEEALSDGPQALLPEAFEQLIREVDAIAQVLGRSLQPALAV